MSDINELDFNKLIGSLPREEQIIIKNKLFKSISVVYENVGKQKGEEEGSLEERSEMAQRELGKLLEEIREQRKLTVYAASKIAKIRPEQVQAIEGDEKILRSKEQNSKINNTAKVLFRYIEALGLKVSIENYLHENSDTI